MRRVIGLVLLMVAGCSTNMPMSTDIPVGGFRAPFTQQNLAAAREGVPGGLLEPGWLPDGFVLVSADYIEADDQIQSVDLEYDGGTRYVHIWQTNASPEHLGDKDPVPLGEPIAETGWGANPLPAGQVGRPGVVEYSARLPDGRTASIDSDLDTDTMKRVLDSLQLRGPQDGA